MEILDKGNQKTGGDGALSKQQADTITQRNQTESPLLRLPGEIRNKIYDYILSNHEIFYRHPDAIELDAGLPYVTWGRLTHLLCVPSTCRQIHTESSRLLLKNSLVTIVDEDIDSFWNNLQPEQRDAVRVLRVPIHLEGYRTHYWAYRGTTLTKYLNRFLGLEKVDIRVHCRDWSAAVGQVYLNELHNAVQQNIRGNVRVRFI